MRVQGRSSRDRWYRLDKANAGMKWKGIYMVAYSFSSVVIRFIEVCTAQGLHSLRTFHQLSALAWALYSYAF